jgi:hypothetical protein
MPQFDKGKGRSGYAAAQKHQGYLKAHRMHGRLKPFYLTAWRKGSAFLQATQGFREVRLVKGG